jgi:hypothetical protein
MKPEAGFISASFRQSRLHFARSRLHFGEADFISA